MSLVRATFRKQVSDGNYGSETAECTLELDLGDISDLSDPSEAAADAATGLLAMCRRRVHDELRASPSSVVRRGSEYRMPAPAYEEANDDIELDERVPF